MRLPATIRVQGVIFSLTAWMLVLGGALFSGINSRTELLVSAFVILFLGVPHGALDTLYARPLYRLQSFGAWIVFGAAYAGLAALVVALWALMPFVFLLGFLLVSAFHFSGDPVEGTPVVFRALYGGAIIVFPALIHAVQVTELFSLLAGVETATLLVDALHLLAFPWLFATLWVAGRHAKLNPVSSLELVSVSVLAIFSSPLIAFCLFFCGMHSIRHILRTREFSEKKSYLHLLQLALLPFLLTLAGASAGWYFLSDASLDGRLVQLLFVSLAALTVPHMLLVDRLRFFGDRKKVSGRRDVKHAHDA